MDTLVYILDFTQVMVLTWFGVINRGGLRAVLLKEGHRG